VEKLALAQHPLTSCQYTSLTFRQTCVQALYSGRTTLENGFLLQSLSGEVPSLVLFTSSHTAVTRSVGSEGKVL